MLRGAPISGSPEEWLNPDGSIRTWDEVLAERTATLIQQELDGGEEGHEYLEADEGEETGGWAGFLEEAGDNDITYNATMLEAGEFVTEAATVSEQAFYWALSSIGNSTENNALLDAAKYFDPSLMPLNEKDGNYSVPEWMFALRGSIAYTISRWMDDENNGFADVDGEALINLFELFTTIEYDEFAKSSGTLLAEEYSEWQREQISTEAAERSEGKRNMNRHKTAIQTQSALKFLRGK